MNTENITSIETEEVVVEDKETVKKSVFNAFKAGSSAAKKAAANFSFTPFKHANQIVYKVCYSLSYGAVYSALVVSKAFPEEGVIHKGLHEGLQSAVSAFEAKQHTITIDPSNVATS
jgi:hypothetical protein